MMRSARIHKALIVRLTILLLYVGTLIFGISKNLYADTIPKRTYKTQRIITEPPVIDGVLNDDAWKTVEWSGDFVQREPYEGDGTFTDKQHLKFYMMTIIFMLL